MSEKEIQVSVQKVLRIIYATVSLIVLIISLWIIFDSFQKTPDEQKFVANYKITPSVNYNVYLKPNKFYDTQYLGQGKKYISNIIDYIDLNFNYNFNVSKQATATYKYGVLAQISSEYELNGVTAELWSKKYDIIPTKTLTKTASAGFNLNEKIKIDYEKYNELANKFKEEYGISSDTKLSIIITVDLMASGIEGDTKGIKDSKVIKLSLPLDKAVTDVTVTGADNVSKDITQTIEGESKMVPGLFIGAIIAAVISGFIGAISFYKLFKITNVSQYIVQQKRILKSYGDVIAEVTTKPDLYGLKIIEVKEFDDLINIEDELRVPILFYELADKDESWFVITTSTQAYRYILKSNADWQGIYKPVHKKDKEQ